MPRKRNKVWVTCTDASNLFGIHPDSLKSRGVTPRGDLLDEHSQYDLYDIVEKCGDLIAKKYKGRPDAPQANQKDRLTRIRADSAEMDLMKKMGALIDAREVSRAFEERLKKIRDPIMAIPSIVKKKIPDLTPAALQTISETIAENLNKASEESPDSSPDP